MLIRFLIFLMFFGTNVYADNPPERIFDEGVYKGVAYNLNCVGDGIVCSNSGITGTLTVSGNPPETDPYAIYKDGTSTTTAQIPFAVGASFTQPNGAGASNVGIKIVGGSQDGTSDSGGMALYSTHNASGNRQFVITSTDNVASSSAAGFRFLSGAGIANIDGITGNGGTRLPVNFGTDTSDVAIGNNSLAYNATLRGKLDIYTELGKSGLTIGPVLGSSPHTSNYLQINDETGASPFLINSNGNIAIGDSHSIVATTTNGMKIGTATNQKIGFYNATPVDRQAAATDLGTALANLGLRASGATYGISTTGTVAANTLTSNNTFTSSGTSSLVGNITIGNAANFILDTVAGNKFGTSTSQKLAFYNSSPIVQPGATTDLGTVLSNLGLRAAGTAYPITTSGAVNFTGGVTIATTNLTITDKDVVLGTTTGTKFGTATTQKLAFYNSTPIVKPIGNALTALSQLGLVGSPTLTATNVGLGNLDNYRQWHSLASEWTDAQDSGSGSETDLYVNSLDKSVWTIDGQGSQFVYGGLIEGSVATTQQIKVYFDGQVIFDTGTLAVTSGHPYWKIVVDATMIPSTGNGRFTTSWMFQDASYPTDVQYVELSGLNFGSPIDVKITGTSSGGPQVTVFHDNLSWKPKTTDG